MIFEEGCGYMPLRYKKFILIFTLAVMFIGLGTFSLMAPDLNFSLSATKSDEQNIADAIKGKSDKDIKEEIGRASCRERV